MARRHAIFRELENAMRNKRGEIRERVKIRNNTYLVRDDPDTIAVRFHSTNIVTVQRNGTVWLSTGGWETVTTKSRLNDFLGSYGPHDYQEYPVWDSDAGAYSETKTAKYKRPRFHVRSKRRRRNGYSESYLCLFEYRADMPWSRREYLFKYQYRSQTIPTTLEYLDVSYRPRADAPDDYETLPYHERYQFTEYGRRVRVGSRVETGTGDYFAHEWRDGITITPRGKVIVPMLRSYGRAPARIVPVSEYERATGPFFKVVAGDMSAPYQSGYKWAPDEWRTVKGPLVPCENALHAATREQLPQWAAARLFDPANITGIDAATGATCERTLARIFRATPRGPMYTAQGKSFCRTMRLTNEYDPGTCRALIGYPLPKD